MTQSQLHKIFARHYGAATKLAQDLSVHKTMISGWFKGRVQSERIHQAIRQRAIELLDKERAAIDGTRN